MAQFRQILISRVNRNFRRDFARLDPAVQDRALEAYRLFLENPAHRTLRFGRVWPDDNLYSIRVDGGYRALGRRNGNEIEWDWIGPHDEYERRIRQSR